MASARYRGSSKRVAETEHEFARITRSQERAALQSELASALSWIGTANIRQNRCAIICLRGAEIWRGWRRDGRRHDVIALLLVLATFLGFGRKGSGEHGRESGRPQR